MRRLRTLLAAVFIVAMGTATAFADIVSIPRMVYNAKWYILAAVIVIIVVVGLLRSAIRRRAEKSEAELDHEGYKKDESL